MLKQTLAPSALISCKVIAAVWLQDKINGLLEDSFALIRPAPLVRRGSNVLYGCGRVVIRSNRV